MSDIVSIPAKITPPEPQMRLLLHSCCAPCTGGIIEMLLRSGVELTLFFYNPNIHPRREYELRRNAAKRFADEKKLPFIEPGYDPQEWFQRMKGLKDLPERSARCAQCFDVRLELAAAYASAEGFRWFSSSCGISRWKDRNQVVTAGHHAATRYEGLAYWDYNWRKQGGNQVMYQVAKREHFYKQEHCGCAYSLKQENARRHQQNRSSVTFDEKRTY